MAFAINVRDVPRLYNYNEAKRHWETVTPIRGSNLRPLGNRRNKRMQITTYTDKRGRYYAAQLHNTECVRYYESGRVCVTAGGWSSLSTAMFIDAVWCGHARLNRHYVWVRGYPVVGELWFEQTMTGWQCLNPPKIYTKVMNRKTTAAIRQHPRVLMMQDYLRGIETLAGSPGWVNRRGAHHLMAAFLNAAEPDMEILARLGRERGAPYAWDTIYDHAVAAMLTTRDALYTRELVGPEFGGKIDHVEPSEEVI